MRILSPNVFSHIWSLKLQLVRLLCMLLVFLGRHVCRYIWGAAEIHFGLSPCQVEDAF